MEKNKDIYELALHEETAHVEEDTGNMTIIKRVPGGWIYTSTGYNPNPDGQQVVLSSCFVAHNTEFKAKKVARIIK